MIPIAIHVERNGSPTVVEIRFSYNNPTPNFHFLTVSINQFVVLVIVVYQKIKRIL